jgi:hypothetical protein
MPKPADRRPSENQGAGAGDFLRPQLRREPRRLRRNPVFRNDAESPLYK